MKLQNLRQADELVDLAMTALAEGIPAEHLSEHKIRKGVLALLDNPANRYHYIEVINDEIVAFGFGYLHEGSFDDRLYATSLAAYIKPEHRAKDIFNTMRQDFEDWAITANADVVNIITFTALEKTLRPHGYIGEEKVFTKEMK